MEWLKEAAAVAGAVLGVLVPLMLWAGKTYVERAVERKFREWEVRFSTFHGRLVEAMEAIRRALGEASAALDDYQSLSADPVGKVDDEAEFREFDRAMRVARLEFEARSFYFAPDDRQAIQGVFQALAKVLVGIQMRLLAEEGGFELPEERTRMLEDIATRLETAKADLDEQFRALAGGAPAG